MDGDAWASAAAVAKRVSALAHGDVHRPKGGRGLFQGLLESADMREATISAFPEMDGRDQVDSRRAEVVDGSIAAVRIIETLDAAGKRAVCDCRTMEPVLSLCRH